MPSIPTLFCLHFLGGSRRAWDPLAAALRDVLRCVPLDLPGFGDAAGTPGHSVDGMAAHVMAAIRAAQTAATPAPWLLAGHSMGTKVAAAVARRAEDGATGLERLDGLILLAGSPPAPEPMAESRRQSMLAWFRADNATSREQARIFIDANVAAPLDPATDAQAVADVLRSSPAAWSAWLEAGSREDWQARIGILNTRALILAGAEDEDLGADAQRRLMAPHFAHADLRTVPDAKHLLPMERPAELARIITRWLG